MKGTTKSKDTSSKPVEVDQAVTETPTKAPDVLQVEPAATAKVSKSDLLLDLASIALPQNFHGQLDVKKAVLTIQVRRPDRQTFIRTFPDESGRLVTAVYEDKVTRETYVVDKKLWKVLGREVVPKVLITSVTRRGDIFLWPIRIPGEDGRIDNWNRTAYEAATRAQDAWVRVVPNADNDGYDCFEAVGSLGDPDWGDLEFEQILQLAFKNRHIKDLDHPVLRNLRGEF